MTTSPLRSSAGFTYIAAIVTVVIFGIMISQGALYWTTRMQREREVELIFRGTQVRDALRRWYNFKIVDGKAVVPPAGTTPTKNLSELKTLLAGSDTAAKVRYLRPSNLIDPITGKEWALVKEAGGRIIGVASTSEAAPLKQANFPLDLEPSDFEGKKKYSEWQFIYNRIPKPAGTGGQTGQGITNVPGTPGTSNPGTSNPGTSNPGR